MIWLLLVLGGRLVITEVMANPAGSTGAHGPEDRNEFVEVYNDSSGPIDFLDWTIDDGDSRDRIVTWRDSSLLADNPNVIINSWWLEPGRYAVIIDSEYADPCPVGGHMRPYRFGDSTLILTTGNTTLGNGLAVTDPLWICSPWGDTATFGTPADTADSLPRDPGDGRSLERIRIDRPDAADNWTICPDSTGSTPGRTSAAASLADLAAGIVLADSARLNPGEQFSFTCRIANRGCVGTSDWNGTAFLDLNGNRSSDKDEPAWSGGNWLMSPGAETLLVISARCPPVRTDIWLVLTCPGDRDTLNNRCRLTLMPGRTGRALSLSLSYFTPNSDGFEDELPVVFRLPGAGGRLTVTVFDLAGREVRSLWSGRPSADQGVLHWDGRNQRLRPAAAGIYAVVLDYRSGAERITERLPVVLVRN